MSTVRYCPNCMANGIPSTNRWKGIRGYVPDFTNGHCIMCNQPLGAVTNMTSDDYMIISKISTDTSFFEAMMQLKEEDIIEYQSRMAKFRTQVGEQESAKAAESAALKCPRCGSTNISTGARGVSFFWGFLGADKTVNRCGKCGFTFKPRG